jgi:hypothetical protein
MACGRTALYEPRTPEWVDAGTEVDAGREVDAGTTVDAGTIVDAGTAVDAGTIVDAGTRVDAGCPFVATVVSDIFGATVFANPGAPWPAGRYRISYVDGCMKYATVGQDWSVNAYANGSDGFWLVNGTHAQLLVMPGTVGFLVGQGGFATFDECVTANHADAPLEFDFAGGELGVWLTDSPYTDNEVGEGGRNPTWQIASTTCQ